MLEHRLFRSVRRGSKEAEILPNLYGRKTSLIVCEDNQIERVSSGREAGVGVR